MRTAQITLKGSEQISTVIGKIGEVSPNVIFVFGSDKYFLAPGWLPALRSAAPTAKIIGCSTAGEINSAGVVDDSLVITACHMTGAQLTSGSAEIKSMSMSYETGRDLGARLKHPELRNIFLLGRGVNINGSAVIKGLRDVVGESVLVSGGLAGDGGKFQQTFTLLDDAVASDAVVALGFHGEAIEISSGTEGGWMSFGPIRRVTKSEANVLFELDGKPALEIYKTYLGDKSRDLPASGLLFPFELLPEDQKEKGIVRTILGVDEKSQSLTLAGDVPLNGLVRLMRASNETLVDGAQEAAKKAVKAESSDGLGMLISCVGRKLVMGHDVEDEIDSVREVLEDATLAGFYSYGEICPFHGAFDSKLHNQTMTITFFREKK